MQHSTKLIFNTIASYGRIIVNAIVSLISTRIALKYLGANDFGLYNLIAGVVLMLSFINGSLTISAQRYFSIAIGEKNREKLIGYFNASIGIHLLISLVFASILLLIIPLLFNGFLNIPEGKEQTSVVVYCIMVLSSLVTIATIPYSALMNAREDLVAMSVIDILYSIVKMFAALILILISKHLLIIYSIVMMLAVLLKMVLEIVWTKQHYEEGRIYKRLLFDKPKCKEMLGFVGWNTVGSIAIVLRNQGVAVALNFFFGTMINAAYAIANQVNSMILSFATSLTSVFTPTIIQAKGAGDDKRMLMIAIFCSKLSFLLSSLMALPLLVFLPNILDIWLENYPEETNKFCQLIVLTFLVQQLYPGINRTIYATGTIRNYQIVTSVFLTLIIPVGCFLIKLGMPSYSMIYAMLFFQILILLVTVYYAKIYNGLNVLSFILHSVIIPVICCFIIFLFGVMVKNGIAQEYGIFAIVVFGIVMDAIYTFLYYIVVIDKSEKEYIIQTILKYKRKNVSKNY